MSDRLNHSESIKELAAALVAAQAEMPVVPKEADNPYFKSKYADLASIVKMIQPVLHKNNLVSTPLRGFFVAELSSSQGRRRGGGVSTPLRGFFVAEEVMNQYQVVLLKFQPPCGVFLLLRRGP